MDQKNDHEITATRESTEKTNKYWIQYFSSFAASIAFGITGFHVGWIGPTLAILLNNETTPIPITNSQSSWLSGFLQIGAIPGPILGSLLCDRVGRKSTIIFCVIPNIITYILIICAKNVSMLYAARFFSGLAVGIYFVCVPIYVSETSSPEIRGRMSFMTSIVASLFILLEYCIIPFISIQLNAIICLAIAIIQAIAFFWVPETPYYYIMKNKNDLAEKSLKKLRQTDDVTNEMEELKSGWLKQQELNVGVLDIVKISTNRKCLMIIIGIIIVQQFSGFIPLLAYSQIIFKQANAPIPVAISGILFIFADLVVSAISIFLIDRWGRKPLYLLSTLGAIIPLIISGIFFYLQDLGYDNISRFSLVPVISLILYIAAFAVGLQSIPYLICGELFSTEFRATAGSVLSIMGSIFGLIVTKLYQIISDTSGIYVSLWLFAFCNVIGALFGAIFVPETKGKSLEQIQKELRTNNNKVTPTA